MYIRLKAAVKMAYLHQSEKEELDAIEQEVSAAFQQVKKAEAVLWREEVKASENPLFKQGTIALGSTCYACF